jgi:hypothetical protein
MASNLYEVKTFVRVNDRDALCNAARVILKQDGRTEQYITDVLYGGNEPVPANIDVGTCLRLVSTVVSYPGTIRKEIYVEGPFA